MYAEGLGTRGFRNLLDFDLTLPVEGAVFLGPNAHGKTSLLEALYYPALFRSVRGSSDSDVARWGGSGFATELRFSDRGRDRTIGASWSRETRCKSMTVDGVPHERVGDAVGTWLAVAFLPTDLALVEGAASERRQLLDRTLSLADQQYLRCLRRYRSALKQRNAALRSGDFDAAEVFGALLAEPGAYLVRSRTAWCEQHSAAWGECCARLGESMAVRLDYEGEAELADPGAWARHLAAAAPSERRRRVSLVGPHRDDLTMTTLGRSLREVGSTGQQRTASIALKLREHETLRTARGCEPAILLDDVFAELDHERQAGLAKEIMRHQAQVFITAPREDEVPALLDREVIRVRDGAVTRTGKAAREVAA